jgi:hypothetical protein
MQAAEMPMTAREIAACDAARAQSTAVMTQWRTLSTTTLASFNAKRKAAGLPTVSLKK